MVTNGNLEKVINTCEQSRVRASPWGFSFRSKKGVGANKEETNDADTVNNVANNVTTVGPTLAGNGVVSSTAITMPTHGMSISYANVTGEPRRKSVNFCTLITPIENGVDVLVPMDSIRAISEQFVNTAYGFFLGKRVAYPTMLATLGVNIDNANKEETNDADTVNNVANNVTTVGPTLAGNGVVSSTAITMPTHGMSISYANVTGEPSRKSVNFCTLITPIENGVDVLVPMDSIRAISEQFVNTAYGFFLGKRGAYPTMLATLGGGSSYGTTMIELRVDVQLKDTNVVAMPKIVEDGFYTCTICIEYE
nr:hypothetical protein [Tanacetum cinerariifolium]